jgi:uridine kinase
MLGCCSFSQKEPMVANSDSPVTIEKEIFKKVSQMDISTAKKPFMIGIAGGPCSGKKELCSAIQQKLSLKYDVSLKMLHIPMESFYKTLQGRELMLAQNQEYNFDHPDAIDFPLMIATLSKLKMGKRVEIPEYDFQTHSRTGENISTEGPDVILVSGIFLLFDTEMRSLFDLKVFTDVDADSRLSRLVVRDTQKRYKKSLDSVLHGYIKYVKPSFEEFVFPTKKFADVIVPRGEDNDVAIQLLTQHVDDILKQQ